MCFKNRHKTIYKPLPRIFRRSPLSEEKYPNRNPAWKQALLIIDFQGFIREGSRPSRSGLKPVEVYKQLPK